MYVAPEAPTPRLPVPLFKALPTDIYSAGVMWFVLQLDKDICASQPGSFACAEDDMKKHLTGSRHMMSAGEMTLLTKMLSHDPSARPTVDEVLNDEYFTRVMRVRAVHTDTWAVVKSGKLQKAVGIFWKTREFTLEVRTDGSDCRLSWTSQGDAKVEAGYRKVIHKKGMNVGGIVKDGISMGRNGKFRLPLYPAVGDQYTNNKKGYYFYSPVSRLDRDDWVNKLQEYCA